MKNEKVLILGGTRYLGKAIANQIKNDDFEIATLSRSEHLTSIKNFVCDRKDNAEIKNILRYFKPNIILDMINFDKGDSEGISNIYYEGCIRDLDHYIMISSFFVYNYFEYQIFSEKKVNENFEHNNIDGYTQGKIESEVTLYNSKLIEITTILRLPFIFSSDDRTNRFQSLCKLALVDHNPIFELPF